MRMTHPRVHQTGPSKVTRSLGGTWPSGALAVMRKLWPSTGASEGGARWWVECTLHVACGQAHAVFGKSTFVPLTELLLYLHLPSIDVPTDRGRTGGHVWA